MKSKGVTIALLAMCVLFASIGSIRNSSKELVETNYETDVTTVSTNDSEVSSDLEIHFIDVGQGDATLIMCSGEAMLIDAADNDNGSKVQLYLSKRNVSNLKYVIGTHPDADHIGGLDVILYKFDCETLIMPDVVADTATYRDVIETMEVKEIDNTLPAVGDKYTLGDATFMILGPVDTYEDRNDNSVCILLEHGENSFLFTGDAQEEAEADLVDLDINIDADVYKVGHHGSSSSSSLELLDRVTPEYAVISCAEDNSYGHPHAEVLNNLRMNGVKVFRTDEQGSIVVTSDGKSLTWNCAPTESWQSGR